MCVARQHAVATICTAVPMVTSVTWWLRHVTQNCSLFHSWRKCKAPPGKLASSLTLWFSAMYTDFAGSYQFCDFGPFLWNCGSYNSIFLSAWNVKYLSSSSFCYPFFSCSILTLCIVMMCTGWRAVWFVLVEDLSALRIRPAVHLPVELMSVVLIQMLVFCIPCSLAFWVLPNDCKCRNVSVACKCMQLL